MRIYKLTSVCILIILLSGCNAFVSKTEETPSIVKSEVEYVIDNEETATSYQYPNEIETEIFSPIGEGNTYFTYDKRIPVKISISNIGTESFIYRIKNVSTDTDITVGILKTNESFEHIYDDLLEGNYGITFVVEEEEKPIDIKMKVKVELVP